jgi:phosphoglycolate phosphatase-like HAD superfamily hydrolase
LDLFEWWAESPGLDGHHKISVQPMAIVFLDLDNTLIDRAEGFRSWARKFLAAVGCEGEVGVEWLETVDEDGLRERRSFFQSVKDCCALRESAESRGALLQGASGPHPFTRFWYREALGPCSTKWVDALHVVSSEVKCAKPDPQILSIAAETCGRRITKNDWLIGESAETDILCATPITRRRVGCSDCYRLVQAE